MAECQMCKEEVDQLFRMRVDGRLRRICEDCAEEIRQQQEIAEESRGAMRRIMEYKD